MAPREKDLSEKRLAILDTICKCLHAAQSSFLSLEQKTSLTHEQTQVGLSINALIAHITALMTEINNGKELSFEAFCQFVTELKEASVELKTVIDKLANDQTSYQLPDIEQQISRFEKLQLHKGEEDKDVLH